MIGLFVRPQTQRERNVVRLWGGALRDADYLTVASFATHPRVLSNPVFCSSMCCFCFLFVSVVGRPGGLCISFGTALIGLNINPLGSDETTFS